MGKKLERAADLELEMPEPFDFSMTVAKPAGWYWSTPGEVFEDGTMWTGLYIAGRPVGLRLSPGGGTRVSARAFAALALEVEALEELRSTLESGLGKDIDLEGFYRFAEGDPVLEMVVRDRYGMRIGRLDELFGRVILAILLQMAQMGRSGQMMQAVLELYGTRIRFDGREVVLWPTPRRLSRVEESELREKANLGYRAKRLSAAARHLVERPVSMRELDAMDDEAAVARVMEIPGIGPYAAGIVLGRYAPIDAWSVIVMSELLLGVTPDKPRQEIENINKVVSARWGKWSWMAFAYILNDLENLQKFYRITRLS